MSRVVARTRRIERVALGDQVYEVLKERILDQDYTPGEKLNIDALVRELSVSSTPIREALSRLSAEGLVQAAPFLGFTIAPLPDRKFLEDLYAFRSVVEPWAASEAARLRPAAALKTLGQAVQAMQAGSLAREYREYRGFSEADGRFHRAVIAASGNEIFRKTYEDLCVHLHMSRLFINREQSAEDTCRQHLEILRAIEAGQPDKASQLMREHLDDSRRRLPEEQ
jgi:DNA-binding GntR family transcriptional regulator